MNSIELLFEAIGKKDKLQNRFLNNALQYLTNKEIENFSLYIDYCISDNGISLEFLVDSYLLLVQDTMREQLFFKRNKRYRYSTFDEIKSSVYYNDDYMTKYMYGLAVSLYLWRNHIDMKRFFDEQISDIGEGKYLEVGVGHGVFFMSALQESTFEHYQGVDLSPTSVKVSTDLINHFLPSKKGWQIDVMNFFDFPADEKVNAFVMGEVLEHVEKPELFLNKIHEITTEDSFIFLTTCINAPTIDHIYLFENTEEIVQMFKKCNFEIKEELILPHQGSSIEESIKEKSPINVAYTLKKIN